MKQLSFDIIVIGSGLAGLTAAYYAARNAKVALVTKSELDNSNSYYAQGGIAAVIATDDSPELHAHDTMVAGRGLCEKDAVGILVNEGKLAIQEIIKLGMHFDVDQNGEIMLGLEGGHSKRRILHAGGDATGRELTKFMLGLVKTQENITTFEYTAVINLLTEGNQCVGAHAIDFTNNKNIQFNASSCILATGGLSRIFSRTTNPHVATGDGIALAFDAGAQLEDLEFVQFHPSALAVKGRDAFLISEAVRGEGAWLLNQDGERFMKSIHPLAELAPRDVVAFAIHQQIKKQEQKNVFLSLRHLDAQKIKARFSNIYRKLAEFGFDMTKDLLPIAPAAHYMVGGVKTGLNGETNIKGLFACGELASTGVMGANRLASNSLLECIVFGKRAGLMSARTKTIEYAKQPLKDVLVSLDAEHSYLDIKNNLADIMSSKVGIVRNGEQLTEAIAAINDIKEHICNKQNDEFNNIKAKQLASVCLLIAQSALLREESRGGHIREDFRKECAMWRKHIVQQKDKEVEFFPLK